MTTEILYLTAQIHRWLDVQRGPSSCRAGRQAQPLNWNGPDHPQDRLADNMPDDKQTVRA